MMTRPFRWTTLLASLLLFSLPVRAQESGLPPLPKPKAKPTPSPKTAATPKPKSSANPKSTAKESPLAPANLRREPARIPTITFNQVAEGNLDPKTSGRISQHSYYDEYALTATTADIFTIQLQTSAPQLAVQVFDRSQTGLPILKDPRTSEFRLDTAGGTLPADGEYRVRVLGAPIEAQSSPIAYTLKINRTGLTEAGYQARLQQIVTAFRSPGPKEVDEAITKLTELTQADPNRPPAYEMLGVLYLYHRNDVAKAVSSMEQSLKLGGSATFRVTHDSQWRRPVRKQGENFDWEEQRLSWLKIRPGQVTLIDVTDARRISFSLGSQQIKEIKLNAPSPIFTITPAGPRSKPYFFSAGTRLRAEAEVIINMINDYVRKKG
jgi:hypothetical protein